MIRYLPILIILLASCERVVQIEDPRPEEVRYCSVQNELEGEWLSDSVWVVSKIDTVDTDVVDKSPSLIYVLEVACEAQENLKLGYYNFGGVYTSDIESSNFDAANGRMHFYSQLEEKSDSLDANYSCTYELVGDRLTLELKQQPNEQQDSKYFVFLSRLN